MSFVVKQTFIGKSIVKRVGARVGEVATRLGRELAITPGRCSFCVSLQGCEDMGLCPQCEQDFVPRQAGYCDRCGELFTIIDEPPRLCGACQSDPPPYGMVVFCGEYAGPLREAIVAYKYGGKHGMERLLQRSIVAAYAGYVERGGAPHECVLPMPLHAQRLRERGFNQSLELARPLAKQWRLPLLVQGLERVKPTTPQAGLSKAKRRNNVHGAFRVPDAAKGALAGRRVLLVDDVMTTGATASEAAAMCLRAGATGVDCCVVARA